MTNVEFIRLAVVRATSKGIRLDETELASAMDAATSRMGAMVHVSGSPAAVVRSPKTKRYRIFVDLGVFDPATGKAT